MSAQRSCSRSLVSYAAATFYVGIPQVRGVHKDVHEASRCLGEKLALTAGKVFRTVIAGAPVFRGGQGVVPR